MKVREIIFTQARKFSEEQSAVLNPVVLHWLRLWRISSPASPIIQRPIITNSVGAHQSAIAGRQSTLMRAKLRRFTEHFSD